MKKYKTVAGPHTDALGNPLKEGDHVIYTERGYSHPSLGIVHSFTNTCVRVLDKYNMKQLPLTKTGPLTKEEFSGIVPGMAWKNSVISLNGVLSANTYNTHLAPLDEAKSIIEGLLTNV